MKTKYYICTKCSSIYKDMKIGTDHVSIGDNNCNLVYRNKNWPDCHCCTGEDCRLLTKNEIDWWFLLYEKI